MVGVNSYIHRIGTVAIFATLFVAICVKDARACVFDLARSSDFELECNDAKSGWAVTEDVTYSPDKKVLVLLPDQDGCLKTREPVVLNSTAKISFKFLRDASKDEPGKATLRLVPKDGSCSDEECAWDILSDPQYRAGEWVTAEHKFPLKSTKEYFVQVQVDKSKGKFFVDHISVPGVLTDSKCHLGSTDSAINLPIQIAAGKNSSSNTAPGLAEISKNLMLTSASVLTLNNLLN